MTIEAIRALVADDTLEPAAAYLRGLLALELLKHDARQATTSVVAPKPSTKKTPAKRRTKTPKAA